MAPLIKVNKLTKKYKNGNGWLHALNDISLEIEKGNVFGIIGQSGAGKSTLIRALASLVTPTSGTIYFEEENITELSGNLLLNFRKQTGMIFQHFNLLSSRNVFDNVAYPLEIARVSKEEQRTRVEELLGLVGLKEKKFSYPSQLSGGEKQRVGIARALANHPKVLFCDEATSALDPKTTKEILQLLQNINKKLGVTIVLITHEMDVIKQICNRVAVIENGKIIELGPVTEIFAEPKTSVTKSFLLKATHEIPPEFFKELAPNTKLLRLSFKGGVAGEAVISEIIKKFSVEANILLGWIDRLQSITIGTLIIALSGSPEGIQKALQYLQEKKVHVEVLQNE